MIIKGNPAGSVGFWSKHLLRDDTNEKAEVKEITGLSATDLLGALKEMKAVASGSRSQGNFMYQANINPLAHEHLTPEQWREAVDTLEKNLGLEGHQRVVVEHVKNGRQHVHVVWNRVDVETMRVADMGGNWRVHEKTSRELERKFQLTPTPTAAPDDRKPQEQLWEKRAAERSGINPKTMRAELTAIWRSTETGAEFKTKIEERGYVLAKGDRRDYCVVDRAGDAHSLARRLDGVKAAGVRERMADIDRNALPTVEEAREKQRNTPALKLAERDTVKADRKPETEKADPKPRESAAQEINALSKSEAAVFTGLKVVNNVTGGVEKLADFLADFFTGGSSEPKRNPQADQADRLMAQRRAMDAMERIKQSLERGKMLRSEDLQNLTPETLMNIHRRGDDYLREMVYRMEQDRERERERGRSMER